MALTVLLTLLFASPVYSQTMEFDLAGRDRVEGGVSSTKRAFLDFDWEADLRLGLLLREPVVSLRFKYDNLDGQVTLPELTERGRSYPTMRYALLTQDLQKEVRLTGVKLRMTFATKIGGRNYQLVDLIADVGATSNPGGWSFNVPGSPDWDELFLEHGRENVFVPEETAKEAWKNGLTLTGVEFEDAELNFYVLHEKYMRGYDRETYRELGVAYERLIEGLNRSYGIDLKNRDPKAWTRAWFDAENKGGMDDREVWWKRVKEFRQHLSKLANLPEKLRTGDNHGPYAQAVEDLERIHSSLSYTTFNYESDGVDPASIPAGAEPKFDGVYEIRKLGNDYWVVDAGTEEKIHEVYEEDFLLNNRLANRSSSCRNNGTVPLEILDLETSDSIILKEFPCTVEKQEADSSYARLSQVTNASDGAVLEFQIVYAKYLRTTGRCWGTKDHYFDSIRVLRLDENLNVISEATRKGERAASAGQICFGRG
ncbi:MAG: hypothetical protein K5905_29075 [Roseibium sp.]|uniref:hypothetical protein n=1 Tax=Roseibium sp. TaxID=1936156 RepID=UPI00261E4CB2|nr:hypothetical protein [Roseibium sp.]MCV0429513.1 hypothetical protein [Roseibium sp.]